MFNVLFMAPTYAMSLTPLLMGMFLFSGARTRVFG